jgi:cell division initiation protein
MALTPAEIRHVKLPRRPVGYSRPATDELLEQIVASFEDVWRERADLRDEIEQIEAELQRHRDVEEALRNTLLSAERMAAELVGEEARARARDITVRAEDERERVRAEIRRLRALEADIRAEYRAFLRAALERLEGEPTEPSASGHQAA